MTLLTSGKFFILPVLALNQAEGLKESILGVTQHRGQEDDIACFPAIPTACHPHFTLTIPLISFGVTYIPRFA